jgi:magnesium-protoporphyrin O-methyltransferase
MVRCHCDGIEQCFDPQRVTKDLERYRRHGLSRTTRLLVEALVAQQVGGMTLLDIGGGVGAVSHALLLAGACRATDVDASAAYLATARVEAQRRGLEDRISFHHGDFVALAPTLPPADVVTLDRVICCYDNMPALVGLSDGPAGKLYGVVHPRDTWWARLFIQLDNVTMRARRMPMRFYVHPTTAVEALIRAQGLERRFYRTAGAWQVIVYARAALVPSPDAVRGYGSGR